MIEIIIGIIVAIIMFALIVIIHEFGHFIAARKFGVKVEEFGIGIPPFAKKLFTDKKGTKYTLNWLPLGGFVRLKGENENNNSPLAPLFTIEGDKKDKFIDKNYFQKSVILLAGVFMNFLLAIIIFSILFFIGVKPIGINSQIETDLNVQLIPNYEQALKSGLLEKKQGIILNPVKNSIAEKAGIKKGENGKIGSYLSENIIINKEFQYKYGFLDSIKYGTLETYNQILLTFKGLGILVKKIFNPQTPKERSEAIQNMKGPIGIVDLVANSLKSGIIFIIILGAIISINLGVFNLLPIPALDGGRFLLITLNSLFSKIFGKKAINQNFENLIHIFFFIILIGLSLIIGYNDVLNILK